MKLKLIVILLILFIIVSGCMAPIAPMRGPPGANGTLGAPVVTNLKIGDNYNYTIFNTNGFQNMFGNARPWRDELTDAINIKNTGTPGVNINPTESTLDFEHTAGLTDYAYLNIQLNHDKDLTSKVYPHIHFFAGDTTDMPNFMFQYRWQRNGGTKVTTWANYKCNTLITSAPAGGVTNLAIAGNTTGLSPPVGTGASDILQLRLIRYHDGTGIFPGDDQYDGTVSVVSVDVHFMIDSLGSATEFFK